MLTQNLILLNIKKIGTFLVFMLVLQNTNKPYYSVFWTFKFISPFWVVGVHHFQCSKLHSNLWFFSINCFFLPKSFKNLLINVSFLVQIWLVFLLLKKNHQIFNITKLGKRKRERKKDKPWPQGCYVISTIEWMKMIINTPLESNEVQWIGIGPKLKCWKKWMIFFTTWMNGLGPLIYLLIWSKISF
jgi:hypothetical protein